VRNFYLAQCLLSRGTNLRETALAFRCCLLEIREITKRSSYANPAITYQPPLLGANAESHEPHMRDNQLGVVTQAGSAIFPRTSFFEETYQSELAILPPDTLHRQFSPEHSHTAHQRTTIYQISPDPQEEGEKDKTWPPSQRP